MARCVGRFLTAAWAVAAVALCPAAARGQYSSVAVFNFHMKSDTPEWRWLEKGLADRMVTDLFRHRKFAVMQRDRMQEIAEKQPWVPDLPDNRRDLPQFGQTFLDLIISGVYEVDGDTLTVTGIAINYRTNREVARRVVKGPTGKVLELSRQLSAEMVAWVVGSKAEEVLPSLPAWTRSIPAARSLYEGVDLYDQGRYGEAWLKFRRARREDAQYVEAQYWVGKMYYFLNRYDHARRALEEFIYLDDRHPRMGDAIKEYLHTYEKLGTPETALELYRDFEARFGHRDLWQTILVHDGSFAGADPPLERWLRRRTAQVLAQMGRPWAAVEAFLSQDDLARRTSLLMSRDVVGRCLLAHHMLTGEVLRPGEFRMLTESVPVMLSAESPEVVLKGARDPRVLFKWGRVLVAPRGQLFRKVTFVPSVAGGKGTVTVSLGIEVSASLRADDVGTRSASMEQAASEGLVFDNVPRTGLLHTRINVAADGESPIEIKEVRIIAEFEKLGAHGSVNVWCDNATDFCVDVDGRLGRKGPGLVGLLPPGDRRLTFRPATAGSPFGRTETRVTVRAGETVDVSARLPWAEGSPWRAWTCTAMIGGRYPGYLNTIYSESGGAPAVQVDGEAIRVVWSYGGDLWSAVSTDGATFTAPRQLDLPISSAWLEGSPRLVRDESGRFVLMFNGDRGMLHNMKAYVSWSRDFEHWSAPARATGSGLHAALTYDTHGRCLAVEYPGVMWASRDTTRWEKLSRVRSVREWGSFIGFQLQEREDGRYELFVLEHLYGKASRGMPPYWFYRFLSDDMVAWSEREQVARMRTWGTFSAVRAEGRTVVLLRKRCGETSKFWTVGLREKGDGTWEEGPMVPGLADGWATVVHHPKWGYLIVWVTSDTYAKHGPFMIRGPSLEPLFCGAGAVP